MSVDNFVTVIGNCTRDPEMRFTNGGKPIASFGVAHSTRKRNDDGSWEDGETSFFDVTCWDQLAENVGDSIQKGTRVIVTGRLRQNTWDTPEGEKRSKIEIVADEVGPSLKWATTEVSKNEKGGNGGGSSSSRGGGGGGRRDRQQEAPSYQDDDEPF